MEVPQVEEPHAILLVLFEFGNASANLLPVFECSGDFLQLDSRVSIEQVLPRRGIEIYDDFTLRVDHREVRRNLLEHSHGRRLIVDEDTSLAAGSNLAPQNQRAILRVQTVRLEDRFDGARCRSIALEYRRDDSPFRAGANYVGGRLFAEQQSQRVNQDRLPCSGFAGQKIQTCREFDRDIVDHRVILKSKFGQHKDPAIFK